MNTAKRLADRKVNKANGILDIDDLPAQVGDAIRDMLKNLSLVDCYSGDVIVMCEVINQGILEKNRLADVIQKEAKTLLAVIENGEL